LISLLENRDRDKIVCDTCSLASRCTYAREGSVCTLPGSEGGALSTYFNTRDAETIKIGLGALLGKQADRLEEHMKTEERAGELNPAVTKLMQDLFKQGILLAKLLEPKGSAVTVNVGVQAPAIDPTDPKQLMAEVMRQIEATGIPRDAITPAVVEAFMRQKKSQYLAIAPKEVLPGDLVVEPESEPQVEVETGAYTDTDLPF